MLTTVAAATFPLTSCCASVLRLIPAIRQISAVLTPGAARFSQCWNALAANGIGGFLQR